MLVKISMRDASVHLVLTNLEVRERHTASPLDLLPPLQELSALTELQRGWPTLPPRIVQPITFLEQTSPKVR